MKKSLRLYILISLTFFFVILMLSNEINKEISSENEDNTESIEQKEVKTSSYWVLDPSIIDNNWSETASTYDWCSGSGSFSNPYVIENVTINGLNSSNCIEIKNSNENFIIRNCTLYNASMGWPYAIFPFAPLLK